MGYKHFMQLHKNSRSILLQTVSYSLIYFSYNHYTDFTYNKQFYRIIPTKKKDVKFYTFLNILEQKLKHEDY